MTTEQVILKNVNRVCTECANAVEPLRHACYVDHICCVKALVEQYTVKRVMEINEPNQVFVAACVIGQSLDCLKYLVSLGFVLKYSIYVNDAICGDNLELLDFLHQHNSPWDPYSYDTACIHGNKDIIDYCKTHGCPNSLTKL
jgi:hypothetical protein